VRERRPMDPVDQLLLRQESDPRRRSTITLVLQLDRMPDWDVFVARLSSTVQREPRLRQRVVRPWRDLGAPEWVVQRDVDVRAHLTRHTLPAPGTIRELVEYVETIAGEDIDQTRPLWHMTLLDGPPDGGAALVARMSHVMTDGLAGMQLLAGLVDIGDQPARPSAADDVALADGDYESGHLSPGRLAVEHLLTLPARAQLQYWRNYAAAVRATGAMLSDPRRSIGQAAQYAGSFLRIAAPRTPPSSFAQRSTKRRLTYVEVPVAGLRRAGRSAGGTLNDAYIAGVTGGIRRYHEMNGTLPSLVPFAVPVSTRARRGGERTGQDGGNRFAGVRFSAPVGVADPAERIRQISAIIRAARAEPALDAMTTLAPALVQLPNRVLGLAGRAQDRLDMQASYVPGPPVPVGLAGALVESMFAFGPLPGPAAMSVLLTYAGVARIGFTLDAVAVPDVEAVRQAMIEGFAEVLALGDAASAGAGH
jgi:diacylglycerol O-acyltransferase / wax synthase